jgi:hypothetical protein
MQATESQGQTLRPTEVVQATLLEDLSACLEPDTTLAQGHTVACQQLGGDNAQSTEQCPAGVDHLNGAVALEGLLQISSAGARVQVKKCKDRILPVS